MTREEKIMKRLQEHYDYLVAKGLDVAALFLQGSQNYELDEYSDEYQSDIDSKAIIIPSVEDFIAGVAPLSETYVLENNEHIDAKDIRNMFAILKKMNISYLEILYTDFYIVNPKYQQEIDELRAARDSISAINKVQLIKAMYGMCMEKRKALCHPYPNLLEKIEKYGYDGKQLSHAYRLSVLIKDYLREGSLAACFVPKKTEREIMMELKKQKFAEAPLCKEQAELMMESYCREITKIKEEYLSEHNVRIRKAGIVEMDRIKHNALVKKIKEESGGLELWD